MVNSVTQRSIDIGFLSFVTAPDSPDDSSLALRQGIEFFVLAEQHGFTTGWVRVRHFEQFLSSPFVFLSAVGQHTSTIHLGTGVVPLRYEDPIRLAEDASTADLLVNSRLQLGVSGGIPPLAPVLDPIFGGSDRSFAEESSERLTRLRDALAGEHLGSSGEHGYMSIGANQPLTLQPNSPTLLERLWYGAGSLSSAQRAGDQGYLLQVSTLNTEDTGVPFDVRQAEQIKAYREAFAQSTTPVANSPRVSAGRLIIPLLTAEDRKNHEAFISGYTSGMDDEGRPLNPDDRFRYSKILAGSPDEILTALHQDQALPYADELVLTLPADSGDVALRKIITDFAEHIAPHLEIPRAW